MSRLGWTSLLFLALYLPAASSATSGQAIFEGKGACLTCHAIGERGGSLGPELSKIGVTRSPESLRQALVNPDAEIAPEYFTVVAVTKRGQTLRGIALNEDDLMAAADELEPNSSAALLVWEDVWATTLRDAIVNAGGELWDLERVPGEVVQAAIDFAASN